VSLLLPLFPLDLVLLPGVPLPLHVFEPRYKEMIAECLDEKKPFGVVRASSSGVADIGCTAEIVEVTKRYDDGRMDILTRGVERFEVLQVHEERPFLEAEFTVIEDEPGTPSSDLVQQAVRLHAEIAKLAGGDANGPAESAEHLSFLLAGSLPLDFFIIQGQSPNGHGGAQYVDADQVGYYTDATHTGTLEVTKVDATTFSATFSFVATTKDPNATKTGGAPELAG